MAKEILEEYEDMYVVKGDGYASFIPKDKENNDPLKHFLVNAAPQAIEARFDRVDRRPEFVDQSKKPK